MEQTTRQGQMDLLDSFIQQWADTSDMKSLNSVECVELTKPIEQNVVVGGLMGFASSAHSTALIM